MIVEAVLVGARLLHYAALATAFGAALFALYGFGHAPRSDAEPFLAGLVRTGAALGLVSGAAWLWASTAAMAGGSLFDVDLDALRTVVVDMDFGRVWTARLIGLAILLALAVSSRQGWRLWAVLSGALLASVALTGHAAAQEGAAGVGHRLADAVHLLAAGAWLGALAPLYRVAREGAVPDQAAVVLRRFAGVGTASVALLAATGLLNSWFLVGTLDKLLTAYGSLLLVKLALFVAMLGLAAVNRFSLTPALAAGRGDRLAVFRRHVLLEQLLGLGILGLVALLGTIEPAVN